MRTVPGGLIFGRPGGMVGGMAMKWIKVVIQGRELSVGFDENSIHVYNAFPIKDDLKLRGYRWNPADKSWFIRPREVGKELEVLKNDLRPPDDLPEPAASTSISRFPRSYSVIELRNRIDRLIREGIRGTIWIRGVVASEIKEYQWASYFELKDEQEQSDVFFRVEARKADMTRINRALKESGVADRLEKDLPVFCQVEVHLSLRNVVDVRLSLRDILPEFTQAKIRNQRDITLEKLKAEGILENQKKLRLPLLVSRIGLITSEQGTSVRDIMAGLGSLKNRYTFVFLDTRMEGATAVDSLCTALDVLENRLDRALDMIIMARGGGSEQSLSVFNDYSLCRRICRAGIPVVTAIGHEKDLSAAELCSFLTPTPATPSGVGQYLRDRFADLRTALVEMIGQVSRFFLLTHNREIEKVTALAHSLPPQAARTMGFRQQGLIQMLRGFDRSARWMVRDQERSLLDRLGDISRKSRGIHREGRSDLTRILDTVFTRSRRVNEITGKDLARTVSRLDFNKRLRENRAGGREVAGRISGIFDLGRRVLRGCEAELNALRRLIRASDPGVILKKGFSLTLDEKDGVVTTLKAFKKMSRARLRFQDGTAVILRKEEK